MIFGALIFTIFAVAALVILEWLSQRPFISPSVLQALLQRRVRDAESGGPRLRAQRFTIEGEHSVTSSVTALLNRRRPAAIVRLIVSVVVDAIKGQARRAFAHIGEEVLKTLNPSIANLNATSTVARVRWVQFATAPVKHCAPCSERGGFASMLGVPMGHRWLGTGNAATQAAIFCSAILDRRWPHLKARAAALTNPLDFHFINMHQVVRRDNPQVVVTC